MSQVLAFYNLNRKYFKRKVEELPPNTVGHEDAKYWYDYFNSKRRRFYYESRKNIVRRRLLSKKLQIIEEE